MLDASYMICDVWLVRVRSEFDFVEMAFGIFTNPRNCFENGDNEFANEKNEDCNQFAEIICRFIRIDR